MFGNVSGKCLLWFLGGVAVGVVAGVAVSRGKLNVRPIATDILSSGLSLRDKVMSKVEGVKEDLADAVAEARVKNQEAKENQEIAQAKAEAEEATATPAAQVKPAV